MFAQIDRHIDQRCINRRLIGINIKRVRSLWQRQCIECEEVVVKYQGSQVRQLRHIELRQIVVCQRYLLQVWRAIQRNLFKIVGGQIQTPHSGIVERYTLKLVARCRQDTECRVFAHIERLQVVGVQHQTIEVAVSRQINRFQFVARQVQFFQLVRSRRQSYRRQAGIGHRYTDGVIQSAAIERG